MILTTPWWHTPFSSKHLTRITSAFQERNLTYGPHCKNVERDFAKLYGRKHAVAVNSGTSALLCALLSCGIKPGDEVLVPAIGWIATPQAVLAAGASPKFIDVEVSKPIVNLSNICANVTEKTRAIIVVHYNGRIVNTSALKRMYPKIPIIEDTCKAMFSGHKNNLAGSKGDVSCFSFGMISLISGGYGGIALTDCDEIANLLKISRWHGVASKGNRYEINESYELRSFNCKPSDLFFSLVSESLLQLEQRKSDLVERYIKYKQELQPFLDENLRFVEVDVEKGEIPLLVDLMARDSSKLIRILESKGIETCRYHPPLNLGSYLGENQIHTLKHATEFASKSFHLPSGIFRKDLDDEYFRRLKQGLEEYKKGN